MLPQRELDRLRRAGRARGVDDERARRGAAPASGAPPRRQRRVDHARPAQQRRRSARQPQVDRHRGRAGEQAGVQRDGEVEPGGSAIATRSPRRRRGAGRAARARSSSRVGQRAVRASRRATRVRAARAAREPGLEHAHGMRLVLTGRARRPGPPPATTRTSATSCPATASRRSRSTAPRCATRSGRRRSSRSPTRSSARARTPTVGVIVLTGEGPHAFCSGGDQRVRGDTGYVAEGAAVGRFHVTDLHVQIRRLPKPVVAMVAGYAIGGGHVLHLVCDLTIAADNARFGQTGPRVGSFDGGFGACAARAPRRAARRRRRSGSCAASTTRSRRSRWASSTPSCRSTELEEETVQWCREMLALSPFALRLLKASFHADEDGFGGHPAARPRRQPPLLRHRGGAGGPRGLQGEAQARLLAVPAPAVSAATERPSAVRIWLMAARPRTLPAAVAPVLVGTALAATEGTFKPLRVRRRAARRAVHPGRHEPLQRLLRRAPRRRHRGPARARCGSPPAGSSRRARCWSRPTWRSGWPCWSAST